VKCVIAKLEQDSSCLQTQKQGTGLFLFPNSAAGRNFSYASPNPNPNPNPFPNAQLRPNSAAGRSMMPWETGTYGIIQSLPSAL
jgi:hypothetical protein